MRVRAFTLIEILIVIAIIAVLSALLLPVLTMIRRQADMSVTRTRIEGVLQALSGKSAIEVQRDVIAPLLLAQGHPPGFLAVASTDRANIAIVSGDWLDYAQPWCRRWPWGQPALDADAPDADLPVEAFCMADFTAALSGALLTQGGISCDPTQYASDRGRARAWNDRWGNPLVVGCAFYQPPKSNYASRFYRANVGQWYDNHIDTTRALRKAQERYKYVRAVYLSVAAAGETLRTPLTGDATADAAAIWTQANDTAERFGKVWNQDSQQNPPWSGVLLATAKVNGATERVLLAAPIDIH